MKEIKQKIKALSGGYAAAEFLRQLNPDVMAVYPITPQTPIIETFAKFKADGKVETELIQVESEHSAMSAVVGSEAAGVRSVTATSSQGLIYMHEVLHIASGMRLPILMYVSARALSAPLNIHGEHGDVMAVRSSGWIQIFGETAQDAYDNGCIAIRLAEKTKFPAMVIMDGFQTSHTVERVEVLGDAVVNEFVGEYASENALVNNDKAVSYGALSLQNTFMDIKIEQEDDFAEVIDEYENIAKEYEKISGRKHGIFESYQMEDAEQAIVIMGATTGTAKDVVDKLRNKGKKIGLLRVNLFRPFPYEKIAHELLHVKEIAVLDRAIESGAFPPLYTEVVSALQTASSKKYHVASYVYGLGGRDTFAKDIEKVFKDLEKGEFGHKINYLT